MSRKSGNVYEKRLIEAYITENGTEPTTGAALTTEDLLEIQASHTVRPRPPELTSIPALLGAFQQEWDALALENFSLQQNFAQSRQELSTALYQNDAAVRVIARLTQERDAAREALKNINVGGSAQTNGDAMHVDSAPLSEAMIQKIESTQAGLMKTRRKRPVPAEWATADNISLFKPVTSLDTPCAGGTFLDVRKSDNTTIIGGRQGGAYTFQPSNGKLNAIVPESESVTAGVWTGSRIAVATSTGKVKIVEDGQEVASFGAHSASVTGLSVHPSGGILASVSSDRSYALYDIESNRLLTQVQASSGTFSSLTIRAYTDHGRIDMYLLSSRWTFVSSRWQRWSTTNIRRQKWIGGRRFRARRSSQSHRFLRKRHLACDRFRGINQRQHLGSEEDWR